MTQFEESRIDIVEGKVDNLIESVKEIRNALLGNDFTNGEGLIQKLNSLNKRMLVIERIVWMGSGIAAFCGVIYAVVAMLK